MVWHAPSPRSLFLVLQELGMAEHVYISNPEEETVEGQELRSFSVT